MTRERRMPQTCGTWFAAVFMVPLADATAAGGFESALRRMNVGQ